MDLVEKMREARGSKGEKLADVLAESEILERVANAMAGIEARKAEAEARKAEADARSAEAKARVLEAEAKIVESGDKYPSVTISV